MLDFFLNWGVLMLFEKIVWILLCLFVCLFVCLFA